MVMTHWTIDPAHSEIQFKVKHLMVSTLTGSFGTFEGTAETNGDDFEGAHVTFSADVSSINTGNQQRDEHLQSSEFFEAAEYPTLSFDSTSMTRSGDDTYTLAGNLTMHGVTNPVTLTAEYGGQVQDMYGQTKVGFEVSGKLNRKDYGLMWSAVTEGGGIVVSDEVRLVMDVQLVKQA